MKEKRTLVADINLNVKVQTIGDDSYQILFNDAFFKQVKVGSLSEEIKKVLELPVTIYTLFDLAEYLGIPNHITHNGNDKSLVVHAIERAVYKATKCGAWIEIKHDGFSPKIRVGSIVEGVDYGTQTQSLTFPFEPYQFEAIIAKVESDAKDIWDNTHGCDECGPEDELEGYRPINPACGACNGEGAII